MTRTPSCLILCSHPAAAATLRLGLGGQANDAMKMLMQSASPTHGGPRGPTTRHSARSQHRLCRPCVRLRRLTVTGDAGQIALPSVTIAVIVTGCGSPARTRTVRARASPSSRSVRERRTPPPRRVQRVSPLIDPDYTGPTSAQMIQHRLGDFEAYAEVLQACREGPAQVMQPPSGNTGCGIER